MKRGQLGIGLVILGVVAIIAVIGLVLLFTRASKEASGASIGNSYGAGQNQGGYGIGTPYETPPYIYGAPEKAYPAAVTAGGQITQGSRTPIFVVEGYTSVEDVPGCYWDLHDAGVPVPKDFLECTAIPGKGPTSAQSTGWYPPDSSAYEQPTESQYGKFGGRMQCFANSVGAEAYGLSTDDLARENIMIKLVQNQAGHSKYTWDSTFINGIEVPRCWISKKKFAFPQGLKIG